MPEETLQGTVERIVHRTQDGFVVARLGFEEGGRSVVVVGSFAGAEEGAILRVTGDWQEHPRFGRQLRVRWATPVLPETVRAMEKFLASGMVEGIGPVMARRLVDAFGTDTLEVIDKQPDRLEEVPGIGPSRAAQLQSAWQAHQGMREVMFFLQGHGVGTAHASRIVQELGDRAVPLVSQNPYLLAERIRGIGFLTADRIARNLGFDLQHPARVEAGLLHVLERGADEGHCALPRPLLMERAAALLAEENQETEQLTGQLGPAVERILLGGQAVAWQPEGALDPWLYPPRLHAAERSLAAALASLARAPAPPVKLKLEQADPEGAVRWVEDLLQVELASAQQQAVVASLQARLVVVTGGPGTGKTTVVRAIRQVHRRLGRRILMAAPTGRAAHRLAEATEGEARTIHRMLEFSPRGGRFQRNAERPLEADLVVVDEASMLDVILARQLVDAIRLGTTVIFVGDANQLPSVGPGNVLGDLIRSGVARVVTLDHIFRQAEGGLIVENAHRMLEGEPPRLPEAADGKADFYFFEREEAEQVLQTVVHLCAERLPRGFGVDPLRDIQVLSPMHRGTVGARQLNESLQAALNPRGESVTHRGWQLRVGDKVMQVRNNYELEVFNGDIGYIERVDPESGQLSVSLDGRVVRYEGTHRDDLQPAFAVTIHKSQGSEYPVVVVPIHTQHWIMLRRDLLYTAVTRAKRLVVIVGSRRALARAIQNAETARRYTALAEVLPKAMERLGTLT